MPPVLPLLPRLTAGRNTHWMLVWGLWACGSALAHPTCLPNTSTATPSVYDRAFASALVDYVEGRWRPAQQKFEALARQGHAGAQYNLAIMHTRQEAKPASARAAQTGLERAAACGFVTAMFALGEWFDSRERGGQHARALGWYLKAAEAGSVEGQRGRDGLFDRPRHGS